MPNGTIEMVRGEGRTDFHVGLLIGMPANNRPDRKGIKVGIVKGTFSRPHFCSVYDRYVAAVCE
jgi:hypothetical protein